MLSLTEEPVVDDPKVLPAQLVKYYKDPYKAFGLDKDAADIGMVRDSFRKACLSYCPYFTGLGQSKLTLEQIVFSYHLIRGTIKGPAQKIKDGWEDNPYMNFRADDILPLLRPLKGHFTCSREYRAARMMNVMCVDFRTTLSYSRLPVTTFTFDIHYCMRRHTIEHTYEDVLLLHESLKEEMLALPVFPMATFLQTVGLASRDYMGQQLSEYMQRVHDMLATRGLFSPRLFKFLGIDYEKVCEAFAAWLAP